MKKIKKIKGINLTNSIVIIFFLSLFIVLLIFGCENSENSVISDNKSNKIAVPTLERYMYIDRTDTIYNNVNGTNKLGGYLKKYEFTGVYLYSTNTILSSSNNYNKFSTFMKTLSNNGVVYRAIAIGDANTTKIVNYNNSQIDITKKVNRVNLELEWWNGSSTWNQWNTINQQISNSSIIDNDFYEGWYQNLGSTTNIQAAKSQVLYSDRILEHCYQNGIPTYTYANAPSVTGGLGRLDIIANGAQQANKKIDVYIIISSERTTWGAAYNFTGSALQNAYLSGKPNPYMYIENQAYSNIYGGMTPFQKQWINIKGFVWFTKRFCYKAVPN